MTLEADRRGWELAGLTDFEGRLERPLAASMVDQPLHVELQGDEIVWTERPDDDDWRPAYTPGRELLTPFVRLFEGTDAEILAYAGRWGVLGICPHGLPSSHNPPAEAFLRGTRPCRPRGYDEH